MQPSASGQSVSLWMRSAEIPCFPPLERDHAVDVCVVGGGISGLTSAYLLAREGRSVVVLEEGEIGRGETGRTSAHLTCVLDAGLRRIEWLHGRDGLRLAVEAHTTAIDLVEKIAQREQIECGFERVDGFLFAAGNDDQKFLENEQEAARRVGLEVSWVERAPLASFDTGRCLRFPRQAQFHPLRYLAGLARACERAGTKIFGNTRATRIKAGNPATVETPRSARVIAEYVVVATNAPVSGRLSVYPKQTAYRTYVIALEVPRGEVEKALFWDTADPYHYLRLSEEEPASDAKMTLLVGGEDHETGHDEEARPYEDLERWCRERFPRAGKIVDHWSGQVVEPADGLAFIGPQPGGDGHVLIATGDMGMGLTHGTFAGLLLGDRILGRENRCASLFDPSRITLRAAPAMLREAGHTLAGLAERWTAGEVESVDEILPGSAAILRRGGRKRAIYRDESGTLHERSAVCPHLGCIVGWNESERTWDCPCHGSRFDPHGKVLNGPANRDLSAEDE